MTTKKAGPDGCPHLCLPQPEEKVRHMNHGRLLWTRKQELLDKENMAPKNPMKGWKSTSPIPHKQEMLLYLEVDSILSWQQDFPASPQWKEPWIHVCEICTLQQMSLHDPAYITPHPHTHKEQSRLERNTLVKHCSPFACNKIKILPTKFACCVLINYASSGFLNAFSLEYVTTFNLQRTWVVVKP